MINKLWYADAVLGVASYGEMVDKHRQLLQTLVALGKIAPTAASLIDPDLEPQAARVDHGRWLFDCPCGAGVAAHPFWPDARCFGCGAVFPVVVFPDQRDLIEATLVQRRRMQDRNWQVGEPVARLIAENAARVKPS